MRMVVSTTLYDLLGVQPDAGEAEIRAAFRKKALQLHPDKNKDGQDDGAFKAVNEAYGVLSDPERRAAYDRHGDNGPPPQHAFPMHPMHMNMHMNMRMNMNMNMNMNGHQGQAPGIDRISVEIPLSDAYHGCTRLVAVPSGIQNKKACGACRGSGYREGASSPAGCPSCGSSGRRQGQIGPFSIDMGECDSCQGSGRATPSAGSDDACRACRGSRVVSSANDDNRPIPFVVPPGMRDGHVHRAKGCGSFDPRSGRDRDLDIVARLVLPDDVSVDSGSGKISMAVRISLDELLGGFERIVSPWGRRLRIASGAYFMPSGRTFVFPGMGMPLPLPLPLSNQMQAHGDLEVTFEIAFPSSKPGDDDVTAKYLP